MVETGVSGAFEAAFRVGPSTNVHPPPERGMYGVFMQGHGG